MRTKELKAIRAVAVWVSVFIPFDVSGASTVRHGPHEGKWALDIGSALLLTDQRAFSRAPGALSRMHSHVRFDLSGSEPLVTIGHRADWAIACDRKTGQVVCHSRPSPRRMVARVVSRDPVVMVSLDCATSCPCPGVPTALNELEYRGTITYHPAARELFVDLMVGLFPAAEGYASVNEAAGTIVFRQAPLPVAATHAPGGARRRIRNRFSPGDGTGFFGCV